MDWPSQAAAMAGRVVHPASRWFEPLAGTPRHLLVPNWWRQLPATGWTLRVGATDPDRWLSAAYTDRTLVTRVGPLHADHAGEEDHPDGLPTSSSTLPTLVVAMYDHAMIAEGVDVLCVTGTGYGTALLAARIGDDRVTSIDVDPYLVDTARERLDLIGAHPTIAVCDITGPLPGEYDRIVSTVGLPSIPRGWLTALRPGGRLVTNIGGTGMVIAADKQPDGTARGQVTSERAGFMQTRHGEDYPPPPSRQHAWTEEGDEVTTGRYPVIMIQDGWELWSEFAVTVPGVQHSYSETEEGVRTAVMVHEDGSWARASGRRGDQPTVHQSGPRRLWDELDSIRDGWVSDGALHVYGAEVTIDPDGSLHLARGAWRATIPAAAD